MTILPIDRLIDKYGMAIPECGTFHPEGVDSAAAGWRNHRQKVWHVSRHPNVGVGSEATHRRPRIQRIEFPFLIDKDLVFGPATGWQCFGAEKEVRARYPMHCSVCRVPPIKFSGDRNVLRRATKTKKGDRVFCGRDLVCADEFCDDFSFSKAVRCFRQRL